MHSHEATKDADKRRAEAAESRKQQQAEAALKRNAEAVMGAWIGKGKEWMSKRSIREVSGLSNEKAGAALAYLIRVGFIGS